jgi:hypothetical protein
MFAAGQQTPAPIFAFGEYQMTTFTLRAPEEITTRLTSAEMRSWLHEFIHQPHPLPPDPGSGYGRVSLTLPADAVNAVVRYSNSSTSSALRRIAAARLGMRSPSGPQVYAAHRSPAIPTPGRSQDNSQSGDEIAGALISFVSWIIFVGIAILVASSRKKDG